MHVSRLLPNVLDSNTPFQKACLEVVGWTSNLVTCAASSHVSYPEHKGRLSIKCAKNGSEVYESGGDRFAVDDSSYLILNEGQSYSSHIDSATEVESFCLFFASGLADQVLRSLITPADHLLETPQASSRQPVEFLCKLHPHDEIVTPVLRHIYAAIQSETTTPGQLEESMRWLLQRLLARHRETRREIALLPPVRWATKVEIFVRLHRAKDFMDTSLSEELSLAQIAEVAYLSPHHFLRLFKEVFHETPYQYLTRKRLERAQWLLRHTDQPILSVCLDVGFLSHSSFSALFRRRVGVSPEVFRNEQRGAVYTVGFAQSVH